MQVGPTANPMDDGDGERDVAGPSSWNRIRMAAWACFAIVLFALLMVRLGQSSRSGILQDLKDAREARAAAVEQLESLAEESREIRGLPDKVLESHRRLLSMYRHCRTLDDVFLVRDDLLISCWESGQGESFDGLCYLPEGAYELTATAKVMLRAESKPDKEPSDEAPWGVFDHTVVRDIQGGRIVSSRLVVEEGEEGRVQVTFDDQALIDEPLSDVNIGGYSHSGDFNLIRPRFMVKENDDAKIELIMIRFSLSDSARKHSARIQVGLHLKPLGAKRYWALDPAVYWEAQRPAAPPWITNYQDGWYIPESPQ